MREITQFRADSKRVGSVSERVGHGRRARRKNVTNQRRSNRCIGVPRSDGLWLSFRFLSCVFLPIKIAPAKHTVFLGTHTHTHTHTYIYIYTYTPSQRFPFFSFFLSFQSWQECSPSDRIIPYSSRFDDPPSSGVTERVICCLLKNLAVARDTFSSPVPFA